jgi:eukaryotic-like serine/threonine-protein kinase
MSLQLVVTAGPDAGRALTLQAGNDLMLGRAQNAFYRVNDPRVSRSHCQLVLEGDRVTVVCNGGSGGTLVNGQTVDRQVLRLGDVLKVGDTELRLQMGDFPLDVALAAVKGASTVAPAAPPPNPDKLETLVGQTLAHYEIGPVIGKGHVAMVFHGTDTRDTRPVALKVLLPEFSRNDEEMQRFIRGMKTALPLKHPNLVQTYSAGKTGPYCWVAMEFIAGENLMQVIARLGVAGMIDWKNAYRAAVHIARALGYAHGEGIVHRNVTPTNILRDAASQVYKLGDLMLAKSIENTAAGQITRPGELVGDVEYMSPERTRGTTEVDARSDLYGLGATVYALLTGRPPCGGKTLIEQVTRIRQTAPEKPTRFQMSIPPIFEGVVLKLLAKEPKDRYQTATAVLAELDRVGKFGGVTA